MSLFINLTLKVWRQSSVLSNGDFIEYKVKDISVNMSFLEMLDQLNENLIANNEEPIAFESDCREGICGACSLVINGVPHGREQGSTVCQLHMRLFKNGDVITIEPWRAKAFPVLKDLIVDRSALDRIMQKGGYISVNTGSAPEANNLLIAKDVLDDVFNFASCIGCGACVAACKNASAMLFVAAKVAHLNSIPQGKSESNIRVVKMLNQMDFEGFGSCTNMLECEAVCPKQISSISIANLNFEYIKNFI